MHTAHTPLKFWGCLFGNKVLEIILDRNSNNKGGYVTKSLTEREVEITREVASELIVYTIRAGLTNPTSHKKE